MDGEKTTTVQSEDGNDSEYREDTLDLTEDKPSKNTVLSPQVGKDYDPRPQEDMARRNIAYLLIGLLWVIVGGILILISFSAISVESIKEFGVVLSPIIALVSAATGFYYGTKSNATND